MRGVVSAAIVGAAIVGAAIVGAAIVGTSDGCAGGEVAIAMDGAGFAGAVAGTMLSAVAVDMLHKPIAATNATNTPAPTIGTSERVWR